MRRIQSATGQAAMLFTIAGVLGLISLMAVPIPNTELSIGLNVASLVVGVVADRFPWHRFGPRASLALAVVAFVLLGAGRVIDPDGSLAVYGVWYVVLFAWVGSWHPRRTSLAIAPIGVACYVAPFLAWSPAASSEAVATVIVALPAAVALGEIMAAKAAATERAHAALARATALLERANLTDDLTGVGNRRRCNALLDDLRPGDGAVLIDLDHFKQVNDTLGHTEGDRILTALGTYLTGAVREADTVGRYGGEEFLVVFRGAERTVTAAAQRLLEGWRALGHDITLSAGAVIHQQGASPQDTFRLADAMLYEAKRTGRDRVVTDPIDAVGTPLPTRS